MTKPKPKRGSVETDMSHDELFWWYIGTAAYGSLMLALTLGDP